MAKGGISEDPAVIARGKRLRELRELLRFSRNKMAEACSISPSTLQGWEMARYGGLTMGGAKECARFFAQHGLTVDPLWLMFEKGKHPLGKQKEDDKDLVVAAVLEQGMSEHTHVRQELKLFSQHCQDVIDLIVPDDALAPLINKGDCVAGKRYFDNEITNIMGKPAIVQLVSGETLVRILEQGKTEGLYNLISINKEFPKQNNVELFSAAEVKWVRKVG